jgi:putative transposase
VHALSRYEMVGSMGRVGAAGDNAAMESSFSLLQKNVLDRRRWDTREQLRIAIVTWIERTYHRRQLATATGTQQVGQVKLSPDRAADPWMTFYIGELPAIGRCKTYRYW